MFYSTRKLWICRLAILLITISVSKSNESESKGEMKQLLVATYGGTYMIDMETSENRTMSEYLGATGIDYDLERKLIIWSDKGSSQLHSMDMISTDDRVIARRDIGSPEGLSVDWIYGNVYWTDAARSTISVASLDGTRRKVLFNTDLDSPRPIVVNPLEGWMFWSNYGTPPKIERAGMDGTHRKTIITEGIVWPNGLSIEMASRKLYWADGNLGKIKCSDYDGSNVEVILSSSTELTNPYGLDIYKDSIYWSDWVTSSVFKADIVTGENVQTVGSGFYYPMGIRVIHKSKQPRGINYCRDGECSHWCLPAPRVCVDSMKFTCACPDGMVLMDNQKNCSNAEV